MISYDVSTRGPYSWFRPSDGAKGSGSTSEARRTALGWTQGANPRPYIEATPFSYVKTITRKGLTDSAHWNGGTNPWFATDYYGCLLGLAVGDPVFESQRAAYWSSLEAACWSDIYDQLRGSTDLSVDTFQLKQTLRLKQDIKSVLSSALSFSSTKMKRFKSVGDAWLTWVYGIKPTLGSIHDTITFTRIHYLNTGVTFKSQRSCHEKAVTTASNWPQQNFNATFDHTGSFRCKVKVHMVIPDNDLTSAARLTSLNPASIAWELLPYSFVVDWFVNIGGYLRDVETALIYQSYVKHGFVTYTSKTHNEARCVATPAYGYGTLTGMKEYRRLQRSRVSGLPIPKRPKINSKLGSSRLLNAAALLSQLIKR